jgi:3-deoxy-D-manno-octulosonate 8-phosphate phosphatase (KDO 8-P phosphatase)
MNGADLQSRLQQVRALALDVDGVLADGGFWWGPGGEEWKRFSFADIMGISLARRAGLQVGLISGEDTPLVDRYAAKMKIAFVAKGCRDKAAALRDFATVAGVELAGICYVGDDVNDLAAMQITGLSAAPAGAAAIALSHAMLVTRNSGGNGAVREVIDAIFAAQGIDAREVFSRP